MVESTRCGENKKKIVRDLRDVLRRQETSCTVSYESTWTKWFLTVMI